MLSTETLHIEEPVSPSEIVLDEGTPHFPPPYSHITTYTRGAHFTDKDFTSTLIGRMRDGDEMAWEDLDTLYRTPLFNYMYNRFRDPGTAEDLAQEAIIKIFLKIGTYKEMGGDSVCVMGFYNCPSSGS